MGVMKAQLICLVRRHQWLLFAEVREPLERLSGQLSLGTRPRWHSLKVF